MLQIGLSDWVAGTEGSIERESESSFVGRAGGVSVLGFSAVACSFSLPFWESAAGSADGCDDAGFSDEDASFAGGSIGSGETCVSSFFSFPVFAG